MSISSKESVVGGWCGMFKFSFFYPRAFHRVTLLKQMTYLNNDFAFSALSRRGFAIHHTPVVIQVMNHKVTKFDADGLTGIDVQDTGMCMSLLIF